MSVHARHPRVHGGNILYPVFIGVYHKWFARYLVCPDPMSCEYICYCEFDGILLYRVSFIDRESLRFNIFVFVCMYYGNYVDESQWGRNSHMHTLCVKHLQ